MPDPRPFPDRETLLNGHDAEGRLPRIASAGWFEPHDPPAPGTAPEAPYAQETRDILLKTQLEAIEILGECSDFLRDVVRIGHAELRQGQPDPATMKVAMSATRQLPMVVAARVRMAKEVSVLAAAKDKHEMFLEDRAVGVVKNTILALDKQFREVGFGSWMPFRFPDQWLMFCGVLRRVLAANGLIHSKHAEIYRRLLEETPACLVEDDTPPENWGLCYSVQAPRSLEALKTALEKKSRGEEWQ